MDFVTLDETICNNNFYGLNNALKDNAVTIENLSGRSVSFMANSKFLEQKKLSLTLNKTEYNAFRNWFMNTLGGCSGVFFCNAIDSSKYWRFVENFEEENNQRYIEITMNIEQVYL